MAKNIIQEFFYFF